MRTSETARKMTRYLITVVAGLAMLLPARGDVVAVGKYPSKIVPEQFSTLVFSEKGIVSDLNLAKDGRVEKGEIVAVMDKEKTEEEREDMELQLTRDRLNKKDEIRKLEVQRDKLAFYMNLSEGEKTYAKEYKPENGNASQDTLADIEERINLLKRELSTMERHKRTEFESKHEALTLRMPFSGRIQYNFSMPKDPSKPFEYIQNGVRPFATVCDDSSFYVTLDIADSDLSLLPPENFSVYIELPEGKQLRGTYAYRRVEKNTNGAGDMLVYFFRLDPKDHETAYKMLGGSSNAVLLFSSPPGCRLVHKAELLTHPAAEECENWAQLVDKAYPGYVIVIIAERDILIHPATPQNDDLP